MYSNRQSPRPKFLFKRDGQRNNGSDSTFSRCSPNRQLAVRDAGGNRTHFDRVAAGCLAVQLQRRASSSGVEPDPRPSQGRMRSATPRGQKEPTAGFAPAWGGLRDRCLSHSSHIGNRQQERTDSNCVERLWRPLALPGAHSYSRVSEGNRTRRLDLHRVTCRPLHHRHRQPVVPAGFEPAIFPMSWERPVR